MHIRTETAVGIFILFAIGAFLYMTFQIGVFRFDKGNYLPYIAHFKDISGITPKAMVKIAGVKVGWVESFDFKDNDVSVKLMIQKDCILHANAEAVIRQEGLLGAKYIEIMPGDPLASRIKAGSSLSLNGRTPVSVDDLMLSFSKIANNIEAASSSIKDALMGTDNGMQLSDTIKNFGTAAQKIANVSDSLERIVTGNQQNIENIMSDMRDILYNLKDKLPNLVNDLGGLADKLKSDFLPNISNSASTIANSVDSAGNTFKETADELKTIIKSLKDRLPQLTNSLENVSNQLQNDFLPRVANDADRFTSSFESTAESVKSIANQVADTVSEANCSFKNLKEVTDKINCGKGLLGKCINEAEAYDDLRSAVRTIRNSFDKLERIAIVFDTYFESMYGLAEKYNFQDTKGFFNIRIHPSEDYFYIAGLSFSQRGYLTRNVFHYRYFDEKNRPILPSELINSHQLCNLVSRSEVLQEKVDSYALNLQFGKIFDNFAVRVGLFEGTAGIAVDYRIPFIDNTFKWITSFEAYDFKGRNRFFKDERPHLKWINKVFITPNLYFAFGADDFISRYNKNAFVGAGLRFADDDFKYLLSRTPIGV